ncbi:hypothetical protein [Noviluteimonas dokdonensis]|nr:hypothetical protein [Lysobacter dokdonensis]
MNVSGFGGWLEATPLWLIAACLIAAMSVSRVVGIALRRRWKQGVASDGSKSDGEEGFMLSSVVGLLALLVGFTFALAVDRFETRRSLVLEEANAIGTAYLRTQLLEEPHRSRISRLLVDYTDNRLELARLPNAEARPLMARNDRMTTELWVATVAAWPTIRGMDFSSSYIDSMNSVIDLGESRKISRLAKVPYEVYGVLFVYLIAASGLVGFTRESRRERWSTTFLFLLFTLALGLIIDIDRPIDGAIHESQKPMEDLRASLRATPPAVFHPRPDR